MEPAYVMTSPQEWRYSPYSWHQATVLLMVPFEAAEEDIAVIIGHDYIIAGISGKAPMIKGRLYGQVDPMASSWQLELQPRQLQLSPRERTLSTTSVTSATSASTHSSYAFISDPDISSSFAASLENHESAPSPALSSSPSLSSERSFTLHQHLLIAPHSLSSQPVSPRHSSASSSFASLDSSPQRVAGGYTGKLLTLHLEKSQPVIWPSLIVGPVPDTLESSVHYPNFVASVEAEKQYNMDPTSLTLTGLELLDIRKDKAEAFEYFLRSWQLARLPTATMKLVSCYFPIHSSYNMLEDISGESSMKHGSHAYYLQCIGGRPGLAQLYIEAGMLYLEGTASSLVSSSYSSLASIRMPLEPYGSSTLDRVAATKFFERARVLQPGLEIPSLPLSGSCSTEELALEFEMQVRMPSMELDGAHPDRDVESTWYMLLPGLVGAGTALVVVGVVGVLSLSWSRRNQGS
ncbi:hypothetical protein BDP27DRAFT_1325849 [Rhodocollybia butyracea]|uniref:CS domain-containing protein n=1 Tax=Rhodocollybia butyracea TaxID=206335 RepID=A0A9P5PWA5_9AGAR|nr:hypothetical protein BDP27DRAFT_1325849 [Rhodocollybia butyracea]